MTKDELWEKYADFGAKMERAEFLAALTEYGEAVRKQAVGVCRDEICACCWSDDAQIAADQIADIIEQMEIK